MGPEKPKREGRDERGRILPGHSLNPGGRPKAVVEVVAKLEAGLHEAADALVALLKDENPKVRLGAVREIFDRTMGKPKMAPEDTGAAERAFHDLLDRLRGGDGV